MHLSHLHHTEILFPWNIILRSPYHHSVSLQSFVHTTQIYIENIFSPLESLQSSFWNLMHLPYMLPQNTTRSKLFSTNVTSSSMKCLQVLHRFPYPRKSFLAVFTSEIRLYDMPDMSLQFIFLMELLPALITPEFLKKSETKVLISVQNSYYNSPVLCYKTHRRKHRYPA